jgi:hypothetical protein
MADRPLLWHITISHAGLCSGVGAEEAAERARERLVAGFDARRPPRLRLGAADVRALPLNAPAPPTLSGG